MIGLFSIYMILSTMYTSLGITVIRKDSKRENKLFFTMTVILSLISFINGWFVVSENLYRGVMAYRALIVLNASLYFCLCLFNVHLTGHGHWLNRTWKKVLFTLPFLTAVTVYGIFPVAPMEFAQVVLGRYLFQSVNRGVFYNTYYYLYIYLSGVFDIILLVHWHRNTPLKREKRQALIVATATVAGFAVGLVLDRSMTFYSETHIDPFLVMITALPFIALGYSMQKYNMMNLNPRNIATEVFDVMSEGIIVIDRDLTIQHVNAGGLAMLQYKEEELLGQHISLFYDGAINICTLTEESTNELEIRTASGTRIPLLATQTIRYDSFGDVLSYVTIFQDISELKMTQAAMQQLNSELEERVAERTLSLNEVNARLTNQIEQRKIVEKNISFMANHDFLTGLSNRRHLIDTFNQAVAESDNLALIYMDLDDFKGINDTLGHLMGDAVLIEVAHRINRLIHKPNMLARIGGDEFLILLRDHETFDEITDLLDSLLNCFNLPVRLESDARRVSASFGVSIYPHDGEDFVSLMKNADIALHASKEAGKNKYVVCSELLKAKVNEDYRISHALESAVERGEIITYYQPKVDQSKGRVIGFEALVRWQNGSHGLVSPGKFIPIAEKTGTICAIGAHVLETAALQMKDWIKAGHEDWVVSVNISVVQLEQEDFVSQIRALLEEVQLDPKYLELEITESLLLNNDEHMINKLLALKGLGIMISMDDFGTEYSSLKYMKYLPIDRVKIDREFVSQINLNYKDEEIIKSTISLIRTLGFEVIAEGVETLEQAEFLGLHGCNEIQGYYYYRPMSAHDINQLLLQGQLRLIG